MQHNFDALARMQWRRGVKRARSGRRQLTAVGNRIVHGGELSEPRDWRDAATRAAVSAATALVGSNKCSLYHAWGSTLQTAYPDWPSGCITTANINDAVSKSIVGDIMTYGPIADWNTAAVTSMHELFSSKPTFNDNIGKWNTASVSTMCSVRSSQLHALP